MASLRRTTTHSNCGQGPVIGDLNDLYDTSEEDTSSDYESEEIDDLDPIGVEVVSRQGEEIEGNIEMVMSHVHIDAPGFNLDIDKMDVVKYSEQLLGNLDLMITYRNMLGMFTEKVFDEAIASNPRLKKSFRRKILHGDGYLTDQSNYFDVDSKFLDEYSKMSTFRNSRVLLIWRGVDLKSSQIKRILTLGLGFLIEAISKAELIFAVKQILPLGDFNVKVMYVRKSYVFIGIEGQVFSF